MKDETDQHKTRQNRTEEEVSCCLNYHNIEQDLSIHNITVLSKGNTGQHRTGHDRTG